jgi:hypothetical protein
MRPDIVAGPIERKCSLSNGPPGGAESGFAAAVDESGFAGAGLVRAWAWAGTIAATAETAARRAEAHTRRTRSASKRHL